MSNSVFKNSSDQFLLKELVNSETVLEKEMSQIFKRNTKSNTSKEVENKFENAKLINCATLLDGRSVFSPHFKETIYRRKVKQTPKLCEN